MKKLIDGILIIILSLVLAPLLLVIYWCVRPNQAHVNPKVVVETWDVINDRLHNSNTDMIQWQGQTYLAYVSSTFHFADDASTLHITRSPDFGKTWQEMAAFNPPEEDIRDPKLAVIGDELFLYALKNTSFVAEPYVTVYASTRDGTTWTDFKEIPGQDGWLFWRPKTLDGETYYVSAYWWEHSKAALLKSGNGIDWKLVSLINEGEKNDETEIEFLPDGRMLATARLEYVSALDERFPFLDGLAGDSRGATLITISEPPYTAWTELTQSRVARLDGPYLFSYNGRVYAVGRYQPDLGKSGPFTDQGSIFARKRTAIYEVREIGLAYITDLPSAGDTSYVGLVRNGNFVYASYYTTRFDFDYPWIMGMLTSSSVRIAKIDLKAMEALAGKTEAK